MREHIPSLDPTRPAPAPRAAVGPRPLHRLSGAPGQLAGMWNYLQRTAAPGRPSLDLLRAQQAVRGAALVTQRAIAASQPQPGLPPVVLAGNLLAFTGADALTHLARAQQLDLRLQGQLAALLRRPLDPGHRALLLGELLGPKVMLVLAQARLAQLRAINEILLSWGEHLRKLAKLDKIAHERAVKAAHELAHQALRELEGHFAALGMQRTQHQASAKRIARALQVARNPDLLVPAYVTTGHALRSWPNLSLRAALTEPEAFGVRTQGSPRSLPGHRLYGQAI